MEILDERVGTVKQAKRTFSRIGIAISVLLVAILVVQMVLVMLTEALPNADFFKSPLGEALMRILPSYAVAMPVAALMMLGLKKNVPEHVALKPKRFFGYLLVAWFLMQAGSMVSGIVGMILDTVIGTGSADVLNEALSSMSLAETAISLCVLAPLFEEIIFRKFIVDRARVFGEGPAIFISAFTFALFHTNIDQFVYAFLLGGLFAYIYMRHGSIWHTVMLHAAVNFLGGLLPILAERIQGPELSVPDVLGQGEPLELASGIDFESLGLGTLPIALYSMLAMGLAVWGLILFIKNVRKATLMPVEGGLMKGEYVKAMLRNPGMIIFMIVSLGLTVFVYITMMGM